jgi:hypothetical protein
LPFHDDIASRWIESNYLGAQDFLATCQLALPPTLFSLFDHRLNFFFSEKNIWQNRVLNLEEELARQ